MANAFLSQDLIERIYPTENDIAEVPTNGQFGLEENVIAVNNGIGFDGVLPELDGSNFPTSSGGLKLATNTGLRFKFTRGRAVIDGYFLRFKSGADIATDKDGNFLVVDASATTIVFLTLSESGGLVDAINSVEVKTLLYTGPTSIVVPQRSIMLGIIVSDATTITNIYDMRNSGLQVPFLTEPYFENVIGGINVVSVKKYGYSYLPVMGGFSRLLISVLVDRTAVLPVLSTDITMNWVIRSDLGSFSGSIVENVGNGALTNKRIDFGINWQNGNEGRWEKNGCISGEFEFVFPPNFVGYALHKVRIIGAVIKNWQN